MGDFPESNQPPEPTTMAVTPRAPSSTSRASHGRGSSLTFGKDQLPMNKPILYFSLFLALFGAVLAKEGSPEQQIDALFKQLVSEKRSTAFQDFFAPDFLLWPIR